MGYGTAKELYEQIRFFEVTTKNQLITNEFQDRTLDADAATEAKGGVAGALFQVAYKTIASAEEGLSWTGGIVETDLTKLIDRLTVAVYDMYHDAIKLSADYPTDETLTFQEWVDQTKTGKNTRDTLLNVLIEGDMNSLNPILVYGGCNTESMSEVFGVSPPVVSEAAPEWSSPAVGESWNELNDNAQTRLEDKALIKHIRGKDEGKNESEVYTERNGDQHGFSPCKTTGYSSNRFEDYLFMEIQRVFAGILNTMLSKAEAEEVFGEGEDWWDPATALAVWRELANTDYDADEDFMQRSAAISAAIRGIQIFGNVKYKEQCFLLANLQELAAIKMVADQEPEPIGKARASMDKLRNASVQVHGDPFGLINILTQPPHKETFFEVPTQAISALQPMIRLFKVNSDTDGIESQVEMKFDSHYRKEDVAEFAATKEVRGHGVGVKSFTFSYEANNPYAIKKSIKAKLVIDANSFSELLKTRTYTTLETDPASTKDPPEQISKTHEYSYIDLALKTGGNKTFSHDIMNPQNREVDLDNTAKLNFRLKAIVGWASPAVGNTPSVISDTGGLLEAINDSAITLNLTPTVHEFGIDEAGRTTFTINYFAYVEDFFDHPNFNIFTDQDVILNQTIRRLMYKALSNECEDEDQEKKLADLKNSDDQAALIEKEKVLNMRSLIGSMLAERKVRFLQIPIDKLNDYRKNGPFGKIDEEFKEQLKINMGIVTAESSVDAAQFEVNIPEEGEDNVPIHKQVVDPNEAITFFYVSDLVDTILKYIGQTLINLPARLRSAIENNEDIKKELTEEINNYIRFAQNFYKFRLMLGPIEFINTNKKDQIVDTNIFNLGDIPISVKYFMEFLTERILKGNRPTYTLPKFLNDFFNQFIKDFMNNAGCYGNRNKQKARLAQNAITAYSEHGVDDPITYWCNKYKTTRLDVNRVPDRPILNVMGKRDNAGSDGGFEREINYLTYFIARTQPTERMTGDKSADHSTGIWHYQIGKDTGIVKTVNLNKTDAPGLAEVRFEQEGYDGLQQLRVLYDVNIKSFLDVNTFPGTYIYVEPRGFDPSAQFDLTQFGIGGYYMINRSTHTLGPGMAETEITAKWVAEKSTETETQDKAAPPVEDKASATPQKCGVEAFERAVIKQLDGAIAKAAGGIPVVNGATEYSDEEDGSEASAESGDPEEADAASNAAEAEADSTRHDKDINWTSEVSKEGGTVTLMGHQRAGEGFENPG